jgi:hypothetical protein
MVAVDGVIVLNRLSFPSIFEEKNSNPNRAQNSKKSRHPLIREIFLVIMLKSVLFLVSAIYAAICGIPEGSYTFKGPNGYLSYDTLPAIKKLEIEKNEDYDENCWFVQSFMRGCNFLSTSKDDSYVVMNDFSLVFIQQFITLPKAHENLGEFLFYDQNNNIINTVSPQIASVKIQHKGGNFIGADGKAVSSVNNAALWSVKPCSE